MQENPFVSWKQPLEVAFYLVRVAVCAEPKPPCQATDVRVHSDAGTTIRVGKHDVRGFSSNARQGLNGIEVIGNLTSKISLEPCGGGFDVLGFVAVQPDGANQRLELGEFGRRHTSWGWVRGEQRGRSSVDADIGGLSAENRGDQEFKGIGERQFCGGIRVERLETT